jgi:hypothetical protein
MNKKCPNCNLINFLEAEICRRCDVNLKSIGAIKTEFPSRKPSLLGKILWRAIVCAAVVIFTIFGFYLSLILTSASLKYDEKAKVRDAIHVLEGKGFTSEIVLLNNLTSFRSNDNWLNASIEKENAYAATNFPFEIMTLYPDFFSVPIDEVERAAILLHEAQHLKGHDEKEAYEFVWKNRAKIGWTKDKYEGSVIWRNVRKQTKEYVPNLFVCNINDYGDCTETP